MVNGTVTIVRRKSQHFNRKRVALRRVKGGVAAALRHARPGHPRLWGLVRSKGVDGRDTRAFTPVFDGLCPAMTAKQDGLT
jgi:hypothetical protein